MCSGVDQSPTPLPPFFNSDQRGGGGGGGHGPLVPPLSYASVYM